MNKDAILATIIGFFIGLTIASAFLFGPSLFKVINLRMPSISFTLPRLPIAKPTSVPSVESAQAEINGVTIDSPLQDSISQKDSLLVSGKAPPKSTVVITGIVDESIAQVNDEGAFAGTISLLEGRNDILVSAFTDTFIQKDATVQIYYTPENF